MGTLCLGQEIHDLLHSCDLVTLLSQFMQQFSVVAVGCVTVRSDRERVCDMAAFMCVALCISNAITVMRLWVLCVFLIMCIMLNRESTFYSVLMRQ